GLLRSGAKNHAAAEQFQADGVGIAGGAHGGQLRKARHGVVAEGDHAFAAGAYFHYVAAEDVGALLERDPAHHGPLTGASGADDSSREGRRRTDQYADDHGNDQGAKAHGNAYS